MIVKKNDILLIRAFKKGDVKAFEELFERYHRKLYAFLFRFLNSKEDVEEIVQDSFVKIWEKREEFIEGYPFDAFLFKIAKNTFLNFNRRKVNRQVLENHMEFFDALSNEESDDYVIFKETREIISTIINGLPPKRREIFLLRRIEGLSRREIADKLGISIITVDSQLMKANKYLKKEFRNFSFILIYYFFYFANC